MTLQLSRSPFYVALAILGIWLLSGSTGRAQATEPGGPLNAAIDAFLTLPQVPEENRIKLLANELAPNYGRDATAKAIASFVSERTLSVDQVYAARLLGNNLQPEFRHAALQVLEGATDPRGAAQLLNLLRTQEGVPPAPLLSWLGDKRPAEQLSRRASANGAIPFRVCDVAFNVIQDLQTKDKANVSLLTRSEDFETRDVRIASLRGGASHPTEQNGLSYSDAGKKELTPPLGNTLAPSLSAGEKPSEASLELWVWIATGVLGIVGALFILKRRSGMKESKPPRA